MRGISLILTALAILSSLIVAESVYINTYDGTMAIRVGEKTLWTKVSIPKPLKPCESQIEFVYTPPTVFKPDVKYVDQPMMVLKNGLVLGKKYGDVVLGEAFDLLVDLFTSGSVKDVRIVFWPLQLSGDSLMVYGSVEGSSVERFLSLFDRGDWEFSPKLFDRFAMDHCPPYEYDLTPKPPKLELKVMGNYKNLPSMISLDASDNGEIVEAYLSATPASITRLSSFTYMVVPDATDILEIFANVRDGLGYEASVTRTLKLSSPPVIEIAKSATTMELGSNVEMDGDILGVGTGWPGTSVVLKTDLSGTDVVVERTIVRVVDRRPPRLDVDFTLQDGVLRVSASASDETHTKLHARIDGREVAIVENEVVFQLTTGAHLLEVEAVDGSGNASRWTKIVRVEPSPVFKVVKTRSGWLLWRDPNTSTGWVVGNRKIDAQQIVLVSSKLPVFVLSLSGREVKVEPH